MTLVGFRTSDTQKFLDSYAKKFPEIYQNDIAYLIQGLRDNYWRSRGSGGTYDVLPNSRRVATKFAAEHNSRKRRKIEQKEAYAIAVREAIARQEEERRLKQQEEERERLRREKEQAERDAEVAKYTRQCRWKNDITQQRHRNARKLAVERRRINELVTQYIDKLQASLTASRAREDQVNFLRARLEKELRILYLPEVKVIRFGSFVSGLCSKKSDADLTLRDVGVNGLTIEDLASVLRQTQLHYVSYLPKAKVPVATFFDPATNLFCDVTIGNEFSVHNSQLIDTYRRIDYRFSTLWFAIRQIAQKHGSLSGSTGFLSPYALAIMLIVILQDICKPAILPRLQQGGFQLNNCYIDDYDCSYDWNTNHQGYGRKQLNLGRTTIGQLLQLLQLRL